MRPVIIYSLPRCRSTATLQACNRSKKFNEPFDTAAFWSKERKNKARSCLYNSLPYGKLNEVFSSINNSDTVSKFFGNSLYDCLPARNWWSNVQKNGSHDIFILSRNLEEVFLSNIIARQQNTWVKSDVEIKPFIASTMEFRVIESLLDSYLRFFPKYGKIVTFDTLPDTHFDKSFISLENQESFRQYEKIINYDETLSTIKEIVKYYQSDIDSTLLGLCDKINLAD